MEMPQIAKGNQWELMSQSPSGTPWGCLKEVNGGPLEFLRRAVGTPQGSQIEFHGETNGDSIRRSMGIP